MFSFIMKLAFNKERMVSDCSEYIPGVHTEHSGVCLLPGVVDFKT